MKVIKDICEAVGAVVLIMIFLFQLDCIIADARRAKK